MTKKVNEILRTFKYINHLAEYDKVKTEINKLIKFDRTFEMSKLINHSYKYLKLEYQLFTWKK